jgi:hypothetical protein
MSPSDAICRRSSNGTREVSKLLAMLRANGRWRVTSWSRSAGSPVAR